MEISPHSSFARNIINPPALIGRSMDSVENEDTDSSISIIYSLKFNFCRQTHFLIYFSYLIIVEKYEQLTKVSGAYVSVLAEGGVLSKLDRLTDQSMIH